MDPTEALKMIHRAKRWQDCYEQIVTLYNWLSSGGLEPAWSKYKSGTDRYHNVIEDMQLTYGCVPESIDDMYLEPK